MQHHLHLHVSKKQKITTIDKLMSVASVLYPLSASPQVYKLYTSHDARGVSLYTWLSFMLVGIVFLAYGIVHRLKPYILMQVLWFIVDLLVVIGVLLYR